MNNDVSTSDLDVSNLDLCLACQSKIVSFLAARKRKQPDAGAPQDTGRDTGNRASYMSAAELSRTVGGFGLTPPSDDTERQAIMASENRTMGGLSVPTEREPSTAEKLAALFFAPKPTIKIATRTITA